MAWLKPYINMNTDFRKAAKMILKMTFVSWWIIQFLEKIWKIFTNIETLSSETTEKRRNYFVSGTNCHTTKYFTENLLATEMRKSQILMHKPVYLGLSII